VSSTVFLTNWGKHVKYPAIGMGRPAVRRLPRNHEHFARFKNICISVHNQFVFPLEYIHDLFVWVAVFGEFRSRVYLPIDVSRMSGVHETAMMAGNELSGFQRRDVITIDHQNSSMTRRIRSRIL
jgi:hypothetical protein